MLVHPQQVPVRGKHFSAVVELCSYITCSLIGYKCSANAFMHTSQVGFALNLTDLTIGMSNYTPQGSQRWLKRSNVLFTYMTLAILEYLM